MCLNCDINNNKPAKHTPIVVVPPNNCKQHVPRVQENLRDERANRQRNLIEVPLQVPRLEYSMRDVRPKLIYDRLKMRQLIYIETNDSQMHKSSNRKIKRANFILRKKYAKSRRRFLRKQRELSQKQE